MVERKINEIKIKAAEMCQLVSNMFKESVAAVFTHDADLGRAVAERDSQVDSLEIDLERLCLGLLALQAPKAKELRYVVSVLRLTSDLERIGDHSEALGKAVARHYFAPLLASLPEAKEMSEMAIWMLDSAIDSFFRGDVSIYRMLREKDKEVGHLQNIVNKKVLEGITTDSERTLDAVNLLNIVRRVERVADHSKNVAGLAPYVEEAMIVRHENGQGVPSAHPDH
jgi:phosphate transport system protein